MFSSQLTEDIINNSSLFLFSSSKSGADVVILPRQTVRRTILRTVEETEQLRELYDLLTAKEFRTRIEGVVLLLDHCKSNPQFISANIVQVCRVSLLLLSC